MLCLLGWPQDDAFTLHSAVQACFVATGYEHLVTFLQDLGDNYVTTMVAHDERETTTTTTQMSGPTTNTYAYR